MKGCQKPNERCDCTCSPRPSPRDYSDFSEKLKFKDVTHPGVQIEISLAGGKQTGEGGEEVASIAGYPVDCYIDISLLAGEPFHWRNKIVESAAMCIKVMDY